jgi:hypothetical protein
MEFVKKHYEKLLLSVVLLGLAVAAVLLTFKVKSVQDDLDKTRSQAGLKPAAPLKPLDLADVLAAYHRIEDKTPVRLCANHNLFNPVRWDRSPEGRLTKVETGNEVGPGALVIARILPLKFIISFDGVTGAGDSLRYIVGVTREANRNPNMRKRIPQSVNVKDRTDLYTVKRVEGPADNPTALTLELADTGQEVKITRDKPYERVEGYMADLKYPPENKTFLGVRTDSQPFSFAGGSYIVVAIDENEVVLSAKPSNRRTVINYKAAP